MAAGASRPFGATSVSHRGVYFEGASPQGHNESSPACQCRALGFGWKLLSPVVTAESPGNVRAGPNVSPP